jgi:hypothetical protein
MPPVFNIEFFPALRMKAVHLLSRTVEWVGEDYTRIETDAAGEEVSVTRQRLNYVEKGKTEVQFLVGRRAPDPYDDTH